MWEALSARAQAGRLNEAHLQRALLDDLTHNRLMQTETLRLPPTLHWVFHFPEDFAVINMAHANFLRRQCTTGRFQLVVRQRLLGSAKLVNLFPETERLSLLAWLLSHDAAIPDWPSMMEHGGFSREVIATLIQERIVNRDRALAFLFFVDVGVWRFFHTVAFINVITLCATFAPDMVMRQQTLIEKHALEFDPDTCTYQAPLPEARTILHSILLRPLRELFEELSTGRYPSIHS